MYMIAYSSEERISEDHLIKVRHRKVMKCAYKRGKQITGLNTKLTLDTKNKTPSKKSKTRTLCL